MQFYIVIYICMHLHTSTLSCSCTQITVNSEAHFAASLKAITTRCR